MKLCLFGFQQYGRITSSAISCCKRPRCAGFFIASKLLSLEKGYCMPVPSGQCRSRIAAITDSQPVCFSIDYSIIDGIASGNIKKIFFSLFLHSISVYNQRDLIAACAHPGLQRGANAAFIYPYGFVGVGCFIDILQDTAAASEIPAWYFRIASRTGGSSLFLRCARFRIPKQAFGLKEYFGGASASKIRHKENSLSTLGDSPALGVHLSPSDVSPANSNHSGPRPFSAVRHWNFGLCDFFKDGPEIFSFVAAERSRNVFPNSESWIYSIRGFPHFINNSDSFPE